MRVPSANSSMDCVQPCSITTSGIGVERVPGRHVQPVLQMIDEPPRRGRRRMERARPRPARPGRCPRTHPRFAGGRARRLAFGGRTQRGRRFDRPQPWRTVCPWRPAPAARRALGRLAACSVWIASSRFKPRSQIFDQTFCHRRITSQKGTGPFDRTTHVVVQCTITPIRPAMLSATRVPKSRIVAAPANLAGFSLPVASSELVAKRFIRSHATPWHRRHPPKAAP